MRRAQVKKEETVLLFGLGGLGFNALQVIHKVVGARVIVSDIRQERLDAAAELGIPQDDIVPVDKSVQEFVVERGLSNKIDATLDFVGEKQTFQDAQHIGTSLIYYQFIVMLPFLIKVQFVSLVGWCALGHCLRRPP